MLRHFRPLRRRDKTKILRSKYRGVIIYTKYTALRVKILKKTLQDLEFYTVLDTLSGYCISKLGKEEALTIEPFDNNALLEKELKRTDEYLTSFQNDNRIPNHHFDDISKELRLLGIEDSYLEAKSFLNITLMAETIRTLLQFFEKFKVYYPMLHEFASTITYEKDIKIEIEKVINRFGEVDSNASPELKSIRKELSSVRKSLDSSFEKALNQYAAQGYLDDIRETIIDNQRVLAVLAMHRRKVKGALLGTSKTGSIVYVAPETTIKLTHELQNLLYDEKQEIIRILRMLTNTLRPFAEPLEDYQEYLTLLDLIAAKAKYADSIQALLPTITRNKSVFLKNAYHPILLESNRRKGKITVPQTLKLNKEQQIIVISGPNAGGKSITLKTIGLLQVMIQSGLLIPVDEQSEVHFFDTILTDIGDNQSIENQLSTYSYRLKNVRYFLRKCGDNTLFLIDEFGTGSDPELGGALAEVFLEEFYNKKAFGIITTHYANLKVLADELEHVTNANMQFDVHSFEPQYRLHIGQAGSSFTFEVAQKMGINYSLINRAKKKVELEKLRLDKTISKLQMERNVLQKKSIDLDKEQDKAKQHAEDLSDKVVKMQEKLESFQELYDHNQKMLVIGRKINDFANHYFQTNDKKKLLADFLKWITIEKNKFLSKHKKPELLKPVKSTPPKQEEKPPVAKPENIEKKLEAVTKEVLTEVKKIRKQKKEKEKKLAKAKAAYKFKVSDSVRLIDGTAIGTIEKIEKKNVIINYGYFTTQAKLEQLELVEASK
ncbi:MAG: DNA mismatch repair protein MutS [Flavobacteriaceae bacterium]|nr:DNA mismatch repair protein MutS [Flavobacteriaceae bacterium]